MEELLAKTFVKELKMDGTFNDSSFSREYNSEWSGDSENAFFSSEQFDKHRILKQAEYEYSKRSMKDAYYVIGVDVGRKGCATEAIVIKVTPKEYGSSIKSIVNLYAWNEEHFEDQAINLKKLYYRYNAKQMVVDANGLGIGLVDYLIKSQTDPDSNEILPDFGVSNDEENFYKKYRTSETEENALFLVKANAGINTEAHSYVQTQMGSGKVKFLIDERQAKASLMETKIGKAMDNDKRANYLKPYTLTTALREQMLNLVDESGDGVNIILKQSSKKIKKDKFSAFEYGMYYIKKEDDKRKGKKKRNISNFMFFT